MGRGVCKGTNLRGPIPPRKRSSIIAGGGDQDGRGTLRGCASTQTPVPRGETAKVGGV